MRRTILNKQDTPKALRLVLFVITMLLLPSTAWGDVTYTSTFQTSGTGSSSNECMAKETADNFSYNWKSSIGISQGDYLTITAGQNYSLVSAYRIYGSVKNIVIRGSGLENLNISYSQAPDGWTPTPIEATPDFDGETNTYTLSPVDASLNSSYLCLSFTGDNTSGGKIYSIEVSFTPILKVGDYVFDAPGTSFDNGKIEYHIDNYNDKRILLLNNATINGNISWTESSDLVIEIIGTENVINGAISYDGNAASADLPQLIIQTPENSTGSATLKISYSGNPFLNFKESSPDIGLGLMPIVFYQSGNRIIYYTTESCGLEINGYLVHKIPNEIGYYQNILNDENKSVVFDGDHTLILNNAEIFNDAEVGGGIISSDYENLTIDLKGNNFISTKYLPAIAGGRDNCNITFTSTSTSPGSLTMKSIKKRTLVSNVNILYDTDFIPTFIDPSDATSLEGAYEVIIAKGAAVGLNIAGVLVTSDNASHITGDGIEGTVTYNAANNTLTLTDATINGHITSTLSDLTVEVAGSNTLTAILYEGSTSGTLTIKKAPSSTYSKLTLQNSTEAVISSFSTVSLDGMHFLTPENYSSETTSSDWNSDIHEAIILETPPITVAGISPDEDGNFIDKTSSKPIAGVTFATNTSTLMLDNAQIVSAKGIVWTGEGNLTIQFSGNNCIDCSSGNSDNEGVCIQGNSSSTLTFTAENNTSTLTLTPSPNNSKSAISGFNSVTYEKGYGIYDTGNYGPIPDNLEPGKEVIISCGQPVGLSVAGVIVTSGNEADILGDGKVSFDSENNKLTLNQATIKGIIESSNDLVVHLKGSNTISDFGEHPPFYYSNTRHTLTFTQEKVEIDNSPIFGSLKAIYGNSSSFSWINEPSANTISTTFETEKKTGWFQESNETEKYSIIKYVEYYDLSLSISIEGWTFGDTPNTPTLEGNSGGGAVTWKYKYPDSNEFVETAPTSDSQAGEYTVKAEVAETGNYLAGSAEKTFTIAQLDISDAVITLDNEELTYNGKEQSVNVTKVMAGDIEVAADYYEVSDNSGTEVGNYTLTVTAKLKNSDGSDFKNNFTGTATAEFKIVYRKVTSEELGFSNSDSQPSGTYYSETEDLGVPDGMVAYIITGINGNSVTTQRVSYIPKGVAVLVEKGQSSESPNDATPYPSTLPLKGTLEPVDVTSITGGTVYVLYNGEFVKSTSGTIPAHRCYLLVAASVASGTRSFGIDHGDGTTALREVRSEGVKGEKWADGAWHDLQGRHLSAKPTKPGLYLHNGKKAVIK